jgi:hypothetical protein
MWFGSICEVLSAGMALQDRVAYGQQALSQSVGVAKLSLEALPYGMAWPRLRPHQTATMTI